MTILALETASEACSVALLVDGTVHQRHVIAPRRHTELIMPMIDEVLDQAGTQREQITTVAFGHGPGSFTGVRIAATLAQGIASARDLRVVAISSLAALAHGARRLHGATALLASLDARRQEMYFGAYAVSSSSDALEPLVADQISVPEDLRVPDDKPWHRCGGGWSAYAARVPQSLLACPSIDFDFPMAHDVALLAEREIAAGHSVDASRALPRYWRAAVD